FLSSQIVDGVGVVFIPLKAAVRVVKGDRPEAINENIVFEDELVDRLAIVLERIDIQILGLAVGISTPATSAYKIGRRVLINAHAMSAFGGIAENICSH